MASPTLVLGTSSRRHRDARNAMPRPLLAAGYFGHHENHMTSKQFLLRVLPPFVVDILRGANRMLGRSSEGLSFAPDGWQTGLPPGAGHESAALIASDVREWQSVWAPFLEQLETRPSLPIPVGEAPCQHKDDQITWMNYAHALAQASRDRKALRILDYGGGLGAYHAVGKALAPAVRLEYHCKESAEMVRAGRRLNPEAIWHTDDSCLDHPYDLIVFGSVLQYIQDWPALLRRAAAAARGFVYVAETPVVMQGASYVAIQRLRGAAMLSQQISKAELLAAASEAGLVPAREFPVSAHQHVADAPEQPVYYSCLFRRITGAA
ncbi:MAG: hypothetical protein JSS40_00425 [Proteobacteria bacterium]|nr:hypothetical protein [Pseudomonadota bacterium]